MSYPCSNKHDTFAEHFIDEDRCARFLRDLRWPDWQIICPYCGSLDITNVETAGLICRYRCNDCRRHQRPKVTFNDKTGTIFADSKLPLSKWFHAINLIQNKSSADNLVKELKVDNKTADRMMMLIQGSIMLNREIPIFKSTTESDEVYITAGCKGNPQHRPKTRPPRKRGLKKRGEQPGMMTDRQF